MDRIAEMEDLTPAMKHRIYLAKLTGKVLREMSIKEDLALLGLDLDDLLRRAQQIRSARGPGRRRGHSFN